MMVATEEVERSVIHEVVDSVTGNTPIMLAVMDNKIPFMERMVALGCSINKKNKEGYIALHFAAMYSRFVATFLIGFTSCHLEGRTL